ncbi:MAG: hypothetical protein ACI9Y1_001937 [Lentisphaeria bacterium]|jgi:hypothetical protein
MINYFCISFALVFVEVALSLCSNSGGWYQLALDKSKLASGGCVLYPNKLNANLVGQVY